MKRRLITAKAQTDVRSIAQTVRVGTGSHGSVFQQPWDSNKAVRDGHARESLVAAITGAVANDVSDIERFPMVVRQLGTDKDVTDTSPIAYAFNVAANSALSAAALRHFISYGLDYSGECYLIEIGDTITPLVGGRVDVLGAGPGSKNRDGSPALVAGYVVRNDHGQELGRFDAEGIAVSGMAEGILHRIVMPYPGNPYRANPLVEQAGLPIDVVHYSKLATQAMMRNAGQPAGLIQLLDPGVGQEEIDRFDRRVNSRLSDVSQKGRTLVLGAEAKYVQLGDNSPSTAWSDLSKQAREDVLSVWFMPESRLGRTGGMTYENQSVAQASYLRHCVLARLNVVAAALNRVLRQRGLVVSFDASNVAELHEDNSATVAQFTQLYQAGIATLNEAREAVGLEPIPGGDTLMGASFDAGAAAASRDLGPFDLAVRQPSPLEWSDAFDAVVARHEGAVARVAQAHHAALYETIMSKYNRAAETIEIRADEPAPQIDPDSLFNIHAADASLMEVLPGPLEAAISDTVATVGRTLGAGGLDDLPVWRRVLSQRVARLVQGTDANGNVIFDGWNASLRRDVADAVRAGYAQGESMAQIARRIQMTLGVDPAKPRAIGSRAEAIARTETNGLANDTSYRAMSESGVVKRKAWYSIGDGRTRPHHSAAAQTYNIANAIPMSQKFRVGNVEMLHPHDASAPAAEVVNCRCRLLPVVTEGL
jgi:hypothetical protein